ncbi:hypothetical protein D3C74_319750 [compost metagenome]
MPDDARAGALELLLHGLEAVAVDVAEVHHGDAPVLERARDELGSRGHDELLVVGDLEVRRVQLVAQLVALETQLLDLPGQLVADRALQRSGAQDDPDRQRQEDRDQRDDVVPEVDHCAVASFVSVRGDVRAARVREVVGA